MYRNCYTIQTPEDKYMFKLNKKVLHVSLFEHYSAELKNWLFINNLDSLLCYLIARGELPSRLKH